MRCGSGHALGGCRDYRNAEWGSPPTPRSSAASRSLCDGKIDHGREYCFTGRRRLLSGKRSKQDPSVVLLSQVVASRAEQCVAEGEIGAALPTGTVAGVRVGCFPDLYAALAGDPPDHVITL
jgi:hypothetical protein